MARLTKISSGGDDYSNRFVARRSVNNRMGPFQYLLIVVLCATSFLAGSFSTLFGLVGKELTLPCNCISPQGHHLSNTYFSPHLKPSMKSSPMDENEKSVRRGSEMHLSNTEQKGQPVATTEHPTERFPASVNKSHNGMKHVFRDGLEVAVPLGQPRATTKQPTKRFPDSVNKYAEGMARVNRDEFGRTFEMGVPLLNTTKGFDDVLVLYKRSGALPEVKKFETTHQGDEIPLLTSEEATQNCEVMHVVLTAPQSKRECIAIVPQYQSFHVQNWMRIDTKEKSPLDKDEPLRLTSRGHTRNGHKQFKPPLAVDTEEHWKMLQTYLSSLPQVLDELRVKAEKAARNNTIVVMIVNFGHSDMLMNFACSAKSRGISISHVLVFATDEETRKLAESLGMTAYYDERNFGHAPSEAASVYGDKQFRAMMLAKVYCVQLISMLGYDLLFQDVDVVWFRDPVPFFQNATAAVGDFDIYFQDDGARTARYAPYSANSGFYFVRHNNHTQHFLTSMLMSGDLVMTIRSHQQVMVALLSEHASLFGLRVKVLNRDGDELPGGFHFHRRPDWMKSFFRGEKDPYVFHASWTRNKEEKLSFLKQMGEWYVHDKCTTETGGTTSGVDSPLECCSAEPLITCHYRDKPSKIPCEESPSMVDDKPSFW